MKNNLIIILLSLLISSCYYDNEEELYGKDCDTTSLTYSADVEKIISKSCAVAGCHVAGTGRHIYETFAIVQQDVNNGTILERVITNKNMPPAGGLSECELKTIEEWINQGANE